MDGRWKSYTEYSATNLGSPFLKHVLKIFHMANLNQQTLYELKSHAMIIDLSLLPFKIRVHLDPMHGKATVLEGKVVTVAILSDLHVQEYKSL